MPVAIVTGSGGLVGSESVTYFAEAGFDVIGIDNDLRSSFFGPSASTRPQMLRLEREYPEEFRPLDLDIRDAEGIDRVFRENAAALELVVHAAAQPSHDWAASDPATDFSVNALGTLNVLQAAHRHAPGATFIFCSTNKVYGDRPNGLPLLELEQRLELPEDHPYYKGIDTTMSIDSSTHSLFGVSKAAADLLVQEYGRYFEMPTVCFRGGCLTGPNHAGTQLHGFLSYLMRCTMTGDPYTVFGYGGKQVRDNIHSADLVAAFAAFDQAHGFAVNLFAVAALAAVGAAFLSGRRRLIFPGLIAFTVLCLADWVLIQDLGFLGGVGTDPNSMIPFILLAGAGYLALVRPAAPVPLTASRVVAEVAPAEAS